MVEKVTKDPEAVARGKKSWEKHMENIKKKHLEEIRAGDAIEDATSSSGTGNTSSGISSNSSSSTRYFVFGAIAFGITAVLLYTKKHQVLEMLKRALQQPQPP